MVLAVLLLCCAAVRARYYMYAQVGLTMGQPLTLGEFRVDGVDVEFVRSYDISAAAPGLTSERLLCVAWSELLQQVLFVPSNTGFLWTLDRHTGTVTELSQITANQYPPGLTNGDCSVVEADNFLVAFHSFNPGGEPRERVFSLRTLAEDERNIFYNRHVTDPFERPAGDPNNFADPGVAVVGTAMYVVEGRDVMIIQDGSGYVAVSDTENFSGTTNFNQVEYNPETDDMWVGSSAANLRVSPSSQWRFFVNNGNSPFVGNGNAATYSNNAQNLLSGAGSFAFAPVAELTITTLVPHRCCASYLLSFDHPVPNIGNAASAVGPAGAGVTVEADVVSDTQVEVTLVNTAAGAVLPVPFAASITVADDFGGIRSRDGAFTLSFTDHVEPIVFVDTLQRVPSGQVVSLHASLGDSNAPGSVVQLGSNWGAEFEWDLDGDMSYGETGVAANHGDEVGTIVQLETRGRDGAGLANGNHQVCVRITNGCLCSDEPQCFGVTIRNTPPTVDIGGPYTTSGSSIVLTAQGDDNAEPDRIGLQYEWDLDGDFVFGEVGPAATNGNEVGQTVTFTSGVIVPTRQFVIRVRANDGNLRSRVDQTIVTIPGLAATRQCPCPVTALPPLSSLEVRETAVFDPQDPYSILLTQAPALSTGAASTGAVFRTEPFVFNIEEDIGFELCAVIQAANLLSTDPAPVTPDGNDGGISFVISGVEPASATGLAGNSCGLVGRPSSTGLCVQLQGPRATIQYGNTNGFDDVPRDAGYPAVDAHEHHVQVRYRASTRTLETFIDGISRELRQFDLFDETVLGQTGPEFTVYVGFAASTSTRIAHDIRVDTDFSLCKRADFPPI